MDLNVTFFEGVSGFRDFAAVRYKAVTSCDLFVLTFQTEEKKEAGEGSFLAAIM